MVTWWGLLALVLYTAAAVSLGALWAQDRHRTKAFNAEIEQRQAGRHRVSEPRAADALTPPGPRLMGKQPQPSSPPRRMWTDASHIPPVMWTVPGRPQAAPSKNGAADTQRIRRIKLHTATTGEIREVGDRIVAAIERGETP